MMTQSNSSRRSFLRGLLATVVAPLVGGKVVEELVTVTKIDYPVGMARAYASADLVAVTKKAFIPRLFVQLWKQDPVLMQLIDQYGGGSIEFVQDDRVPEDTVYLMDREVAAPLFSTLHSEKFGDI